MSGRRKTAAAFMILFGLRLCSAEEAPLSKNQLSVSNVVARLAMMDEARLQSLQGYSSVRRFTLQNTRFGTFAAILVRMSYLRPGIKKFEVVSELGPGVIRKSVLHRVIKTELEAAQPDLRAATRIAAENYSFGLVGMGEQNGRPCYVLHVEPKALTKYLFIGRLWVDAEDFTVARIEGSGAVKPSIWIRKTVFVHRYRKVGAFWLPASNNSESDVRAYGKTIVKVDYDYRINATAFPAAGTVSPWGSARTGGKQ